MGDVTRILEAIDQGDSRASDELLPLVYDELRRLAAQKLSQEKPGQTLQATALVHEAYLRLVGSEDQQWKSRGHFFGAAAEAMRRVLIESARRKQQLKHGGGLQRVELDHAASVTNASPEQLLMLDEALSALEKDDPTAAKIFGLHYFTGLSVDQSAESLGISRATAYRHWTFARAWLQSQLTAPSG